MIALLLIDIQEGLDEAEYWGGSRNNLQAEENCRRILDYFREKSWPLYHIQHCSTNPDSPLFPDKKGNEIKSIVAPAKGEQLIQKNTNSAFIGTGLDKTLQNEGVNTLVMVGLTTDHCVSATVCHGADLGFKAYLVSDATATYAKTGIEGKIYNAELMHQTSLARLREEFATIVSTAKLLSKLRDFGPAGIV